MSDGDEWVEKFDKKSGRKYWKNTKNGKSTWKNPFGSDKDDLKSSSLQPTEDKQGVVGEDDEWVEKFDSKRLKKYWKSKVTGKSVWENPHTTMSATADLGSPSNPTVAANTVPAPVPAPASTPVESEWVEKFDAKKGKKYWKNKATGKSTWVDPNKGAAPAAPSSNALPAGSVPTLAVPTSVESEWVEKFDAKKGKKYWKNKVTGKSTWVDPNEGAAPATPAAPSSENAEVVESNDTNPISDELSPSVDKGDEWKPQKEWQEMFDSKKQKKYWRSRLNPDQVRYTDPYAEDTEHDVTTDVISSLASAALGASLKKTVTPVETSKKDYSQPLLPSVQLKKVDIKPKVEKKSDLPVIKLKSVESPMKNESKVYDEVPSVDNAVESDWVEKYDFKKEKKYWRNKVTGKSTWVDPNKGAASATTSTATDKSPAPVGADMVVDDLLSLAPAPVESEWVEKFDAKKGKKYWKNKATGKSTWVDPNKGAAPISIAAVKSNDATTDSTTGGAPVPGSVDGASVPAAPVESEWVEKFDAKKGKKYWKNKATGKSTWVDPNKGATPAAPISIAVVKPNDVDITATTTIDADSSMSFLSPVGVQTTPSHPTSFQNGLIIPMTPVAAPSSSRTLAIMMDRDSYADIIGMDIDVDCKDLKLSAFDSSVDPIIIAFDTVVKINVNQLPAKGEISLPTYKPGSMEVFTNLLSNESGDENLHLLLISADCAHSIAEYVKRNHPSIDVNIMTPSEMIGSRTSSSNSEIFIQNLIKCSTDHVNGAFRWLNEGKCQYQSWVCVYVNDNFLTYILSLSRRWFST